MSHPVVIPVLRELVRCYQAFERVSKTHIRLTGLTPPQQPLGPMHVLTQLLANAFSSPPRDTPRRNAPP